MAGRLRKILQYEKIKPLLYNEELRTAYLGTSITGGELRGKTVLVTGASGGIGTAMCLRFLLEGCRVVAVGRNKKKLNDVLEYIRMKIPSASVDVMEADWLDKGSIENCVEELKKRDNFIDILVNNAGVFTEVDKRRKFRTVTQEQFMAVWETNYMGTVHITELITDEMQRRGISGRIINIASICAEERNFQYTPYGMSKAAIVQYTVQMCEKYENLSIHAIAPGSVATNMGNLKKD